MERTIREPAWRWRHLVLAVGVYCTVTGGQPEVTFLSLLTALVYGALTMIRNVHLVPPRTAQTLSENLEAVANVVTTDDNAGGPLPR